MRRDDDDYEDDDYEDDRGRDRSRPFPGSVYFAGILWIILGSVMFINVTISLVMMLINAGQAQGQGGSYAVGQFIGVLIGFLFGFAFVRAGIQTVKGTATETLGNAIGSIVLGILGCGLGGIVVAGAFFVQNLPRGGNETATLVLMIMSGVYLLGGTGLLVAGIMALVGRQAYKDWRRSQRRY